MEKNLNTRNTKQKKYILNYLKENKDKHFTIKDIEVELDKKIGTTTIYRMINNLIEEGYVFKTPLTNKQGYCYQYNEKKEECHQHYHLICEECSELIHFESEEFENIKNEALNKEEFYIDMSKVTFYGKCKNCKNKSTNNKIY